ncbi:hypothetical protein [Amycolatopsis viridis]|uniref:Flagellar biosynthesis GTPase FlhF n=1 Tax=Amycolatopsis viridis TaxID=185678 RepID=A0ABX0SQL4_9PSEU|nr:hypothetical protein [Amycolatopsis viridis]NIH77630.1 flagellar biosynthesis GTPase FlhF [Amycolatopsis viridis]
MTRAADSVGESVKAGLLGLSKRAVEVGKAGAEVTAQAAQAAEKRLSESTEEARREAARRGRQARKDLTRASKQARKEAAERLAELRKPGRKARKAAFQAAKAAGESKRAAKKEFKQARKDFRAALEEAKLAAKGARRRRRWPLFLVLGVVAAAGAAVALRSKQEPAVATEPPKAAPKPVNPESTTNGQHAPSPSPAEKQN